MPRDSTEKKLAVIWESVLGVSGIRRSDDFFALGGTSIQAVEVLTGLENRFGLALSPAVLVEHSTLERLASLVARDAVGPSNGPLVRLRPAADGRPLFLVHGGHGEVARYVQLARLLPERPIYGLQCVGLQGERLQRLSIPAMARDYLSQSHRHRFNWTLPVGGLVYGRTDRR